MEICPKCGLPKEICICSEIGKGEQEIKIITEKRKFGKLATLVKGFDKNVNIKEIEKELKKKLACGGTVKNDVIELQGDHQKKIRKILIDLGFKGENIK
jgi:translation initiation factor 1